MSNDWQTLRRSSLLGPKSGLSLSQSQQILHMNESKHRSRRVSLNSLCNRKTSVCGLTLIPDLAALECTQPSVETLSRLQSSQSSALHSKQTNCVSKESTIGSTKSCKPLKSYNGLNETQNQCKTQSVVNQTNSISGPTSASSATPTAMLPTISYDNIVMSRPSIDMTGRMSRRSSKSTPESFTCSQQSILSAMDRFVKAVNNMDSTVLVPSKLRDMDMAGPKVVRIPPPLANTDLHSFYCMLNDVKKELLWGPGTTSALNQTTSLMPLSGRSSPRDLKHIRQPSDDSLGSLGSTASSSSDPDTDSDADSLMTDRDSVDEHTSHLAAAFRHHLQGLHTILHQLADSADYLSSRYQEDIDASSL